MSGRGRFRRTRQNRSFGRAQGAKGQSDCGSLWQRHGKQKAIQAFGVGHGGLNRVPISVEPDFLNAAIGAKFDQHRAFHRSRHARPGEGERQGQHEAREDVEDSLHGHCLPAGNGFDIDKDQMAKDPAS
jgi:hypothetical protein